MKKYTTVYFDLDGTLLDFTKTEHRAVKKMLRMHSLPATDEVAAVYSKINLSFWEAFERGDIKKEEIFTGRFIKLLEFLGEERDVSSMAQDFFKCLSEGHDVIDGAPQILSYIRERGYKIYVTTNGVASTQKRRIEESGLKNYFDAVFVSENTGSQKPDKKYFDYVIEHSDEKERKNILIIGDSQTSDILGGINSGIDTCFYNPYHKEAVYTSKFEIFSLCELEKILP